MIEGIFLVFVMVTLNQVAFSRFAGEPWQIMLINLFTFPFLIWAALRFRLLGAVTTSMLLGLIMVANAVGRTFSLSASGSVLVTIIITQLFLAVASLETLLLAAVITERRQSEQELGKSEGKFRNLFEHAPLGISMTGIDGSINVNKAFCSMMGYSAGELAAKKWMEITHPDDIQLTSDYMRSLLEGKADQARFEKRFIRKNGQIIWTDLSSYLHRDGDRKPEYFITFIDDITERKKWEEQLTLLKLSVDVSPEGAYWMDGQGRFLYASEAGCKALGYTLEELLHMQVSDVNPKATPERWAEVWKYLKIHKTSTIESVHRRKDGSEFPVELSSTYVKFGEQEYCTGFARDITERKQAEELLRRRKQEFQTLVENSPDAITRLDLEGRYLYVNPARAAFFGKQPAEIIGKSSWDLLSPDEKNEGEIADQQFKRILQDNKEHIIEYQTLTPLGLRWVQSREVPEYAEDGSLESVLVVTRDIEKLKQAEEAVQKSEEHLRAVLDATPFPVAVVDPKADTILFWSQERQGKIRPHRIQRGGVVPDRLPRPGLPPAGDRALESCA